MIANKNTSQNPMANRRHKGNISMEMYSQADKMESKTKRNQEQRLQNILKMQDQNMKRGMGIAHKNRRL
jgi:ribosomal protein S30